MFLFLKDVHAILIEIQDPCQYSIHNLFYKLMNWYIPHNIHMQWLQVIKYCLLNVVMI